MAVPNECDARRVRIVELRQYVLHPEKRDILIDLFDREFIDPQEALGMTVIGQFRDLDDPDRFVWLRGFHDMKRRAEGLQGFYDGPVWKEHRTAANATMIDSDNVLLLRPVTAASGFSPHGVRRALGGANASDGMVVAVVYPFLKADGETAVDYIEGALRPALLAIGARLLACLVSEDSPNNFPRLPVREDAEVLVWFAGCAEISAAERLVTHDGELSASITRPPRAGPPLQVLRLVPTSRSALTGSSRACTGIPD